MSFFSIKWQSVSARVQWAVRAQNTPRTIRYDTKYLVGRAHCGHFRPNNLQKWGSTQLANDFLGKNECIDKNLKGVKKS